MAKRLIAEGALLGKTQPEIVGMLGQPIGLRESTWHMHYALGHLSLIPPGYDWLVIRLGADGRAAERRIIQF